MSGVQNESNSTKKAIQSNPGKSTTDKTVRRATSSVPVSVNLELLAPDSEIDKPEEDSSSCEEERPVDSCDSSEEDN